MQAPVGFRPRDRGEEVDKHLAHIRLPVCMSLYPFHILPLPTHPSKLAVFSLHCTETSFLLLISSSSTSTHAPVSDPDLGLMKNKPEG